MIRDLAAVDNICIRVVDPTRLQNSIACWVRPEEAEEEEAEEGGEEGAEEEEEATPQPPKKKKPV